jgi:hypothetical protein
MYGSVFRAPEQQHLAATTANNNSKPQPNQVSNQTNQQANDKPNSNQTEEQAKQATNDNRQRQ